MTLPHFLVVQNIGQLLAQSARERKSRRTRCVAHAAGIPHSARALWSLRDTARYVSHAKTDCNAFLWGDSVVNERCAASIICLVRSMHHVFRNARSVLVGLSERLDNMAATKEMSRTRNDVYDMQSVLRWTLYRLFVQRCVDVCNTLPTVLICCLSNICFAHRCPPLRMCCK